MIIKDCIWRYPIGIKQTVILQTEIEPFPTLKALSNLNVYLHPREMQIMWENRYNEIPIRDLFNLKRVILSLISTPESEIMKMEDSSNQLYVNLFIFYNTWNIKYFKKKKEETENEGNRLLNLFRMYS